MSNRRSGRLDTSQNYGNQQYIANNNTTPKMVLYIINGVKVEWETHRIIKEIETIEKIKETMDAIIILKFKS